MKQLINVLVVIAAIAFIVATIARFLLGGQFLGYEPVVYWRGAIGLLAFAVVLVLIQIRDK